MMGSKGQVKGSIYQFNLKKPFTDELRDSKQDVKEREGKREER
jgi:hypothetical protein